MTITEDVAAEECAVCHFHFASATEQIIQRKRIEWQEKVAFEHKNKLKSLINCNLKKEREEKLMRKEPCRT